ncbi:MAG: tripartite tricarboxylate transporter TctB family protein [Roseiarcus sp.]
MSKYNKDHYGGGLMLLLGVGILLQGATYQVGTLSHMGPGFFPVALGAILALVGVAIFFTAERSAPHVAEERLPPEWRGWILIVSSMIAFIVLGTYGGLAPATFAVVFISALADRKHTIKSAIVLALAMVAVCAVIFRWALDLQFPLFGWG